MKRQIARKNYKKNKNKHKSILCTLKKICFKMIVNSLYINPLQGNVVMPPMNFSEMVIELLHVSLIETGTFCLTGLFRFSHIVYFFSSSIASTFHQQSGLPPMILERSHFFQLQTVTHQTL